jgi:DNA-binding IscR family transcriptional regulator
MVEVVELLSRLQVATGGRLIERISSKNPEAVSASYLRKILAKMSANKLIRPQGNDGYVLAMRVEDITLRTLLEACGSISMDTLIDSDTVVCRVEKRLLALAESVPLADLLSRA